MNITKLQQSAFILESNGRKVGFDIGSYTPLEELDNLKIDALIVSHRHGDHFSLDHIKKLAPKELYLSEECISLLGEEKLVSKIIKIKSGNPFDVCGVVVTPFDVDHGPNIKVVPKENFGFLIKSDSKTAYFAGDMFAPSGINVKDLEVDFALIPVGGFYTFGPEEAVSFIIEFKKIGEVIPMHYENAPEMRQEFLSKYASIKI
jgi:L-ascorbate metabolism protein UlaG (beta-lactamase superfamily)